MNRDITQDYLADDNILAGEMIENDKSREKYIKATFTQDDGCCLTSHVPLYSRWPALYLNDEKDVAEYLRSVKTYFSHNKMEGWKREQWAKWEDDKGEAAKYIFKALLSLEGEYKLELPGGVFSGNPSKVSRR